MGKITLSIFPILLSIIYSTVVTAASASGDFISNIEGVSKAQLSPDYWIEQTENAEQLLLTKQQIDQLNQKQFASQRYLIKPLTLPKQLAGQQIKNWILDISKPSKYPRFYQNGKGLQQADYQKLSKNLALTKIKPTQPVNYALVVNRSSLRTFPTDIRVLSENLDANLDRFQESAVFPGEAVAVLHISQDKQWVFVQNYHYRAWVKVKDIAIGSHKQISGFINAEHRLVVTGARVFTSYSPNISEISQVPLAMGVSLPLLTRKQLNDHYIDQHNVYASYVVQLPTRNAKGELVIQPALIARSQDVSIGYLALTKENLIKQAFKFLGERYGWGHDFNARDCSGFIGEVFKSFGLLLPRNTSQQQRANIGSEIETKGMSLATKSELAQQAELGQLIFLPGHVAMVLGKINGQPYIIHDVYGMSYQAQSGEQVTGKLNGVSVTPLLPFTSYIEKMRTIKSLW